jgi:hypothetical protein
MNETDITQPQRSIQCRHSEFKYFSSLDPQLKLMAFTAFLFLNRKCFSQLLQLFAFAQLRIPHISCNAAELARKTFWLQNAVRGLRSVAEDISSL